MAASTTQVKKKLWLFGEERQIESAYTGYICKRVKKKTGRDITPNDVLDKIKEFTWIQDFDKEVREWEWTAHDTSENQKDYMEKVGNIVSKMKRRYLKRSNVLVAALSTKTTDQGAAQSEEKEKRVEEGTCQLGQCSICQEQFESISSVSVLPCGHTFHLHCVLGWLERSNTCPSCRKETDEKGVVPQIFFDYLDTVPVPPTHQLTDTLKITALEDKLQKQRNQTQTTLSNLEGESTKSEGTIKRLKEEQKKQTDIIEKLKSELKTLSEYKSAVTVTLKRLLNDDIPGSVPSGSKKKIKEEEGEGDDDGGESDLVVNDLGERDSEESDSEGSDTEVGPSRSLSRRPSPWHPWKRGVKREHVSDGEESDSS